MALHFVTGSTGSGKSTHIYKKIIEASMEDMRGHFLVIVPEQFTLETQRRLVSLHPAHSVLNIDILSFDRLAYRVFDEFCEDGLTLLDDTGKNLILRRVAEEVSEELLVLKNKIRSPGYTDQVKSLLSEFEQYDMDAEGIAALAEVPGVSAAFKNKIHDICLIREKYMEYISRDHVTAEQRYGRLAMMLPESKLLRDAVVVLDGYTGFTPIQNVLLEQILSLSKECYVTVTMDEREEIFSLKEHELFAMSKKMIRSLMSIAKDMGVEVADPIKIGGGEYPTRFIPGGRLSFLEKNIFIKNRRHGIIKKFEPNDAGDFVRLIRLDSPREELTFAASVIRRMIADTGASLKYSDFAIVSGAPEDYEAYIDEVFLDYDIPVFYDSVKGAVFMPALDFLLSAMSVVAYGFKYDDVVGFLRTGFTDFSQSDIDLFDHFLYRTGIRGAKKYEHIFKIRPAEFSPEELSRINEIRDELYKSFLPLMEVFLKKHPIGEHTGVLRDFMLSYDIEGKLLDKKEALIQRGDEALGLELDGVYSGITELLDKMDALLPGVSTDGEEFMKLFAAGLEAMDFGTIPQDRDRVIFGDIERTRLSGVKYLFLIGANDCIIPKSSASPNILSQTERMVLYNGGVELAPTLRERSFMQRFYLYELLCQGSRGLFVTFAGMGKDGSTLRPSYIIKEISGLYRDVFVEKLDRRSAPGFWITEKKEAMETFILLLRRLLEMGGLRDEDGRVFGLLQKKLGTDYPREMDEIFEDAFFTHTSDAISRAVMRAISGDRMHVSVSRLEKYAACAYAYFLNYTLGLKERREPDFETADMGTLYHEALKLYSDLIHEDGRSWRDVTEEEQEDYLDRAVSAAYETVMRTEAMESHRDRYILNSMRQTLKRTVWAIHRQVRGGRFEPRGFEVQLREVGSGEALSYELSDKSIMTLTGQIDRIDTCEEDDRIMVKIIDYKSGTRSIDYLSMYFGLQIQLVFYMNAAVEGMREKYPEKLVIPAAFFYYHIDDPMIEAPHDIEDEDLDGMLIRELRPTGSISEDTGVIAALDTQAADAMAEGVSYKSEVAKIELKKGGELSSKSETATPEEMDIMGDYVRFLIRRMGEDMTAGRIDVAPYRNKDKNACTYCPYHGVCGFDTGMPGYNFRDLPKLGGRSEIIELMKQKDK